jgi:protein phosphatase 1 regulatory subunit 7
MYPFLLTTVALQIRSISSLSELQGTSSLEELYVASNKVAEMVGISHLTHLKVLELGSNRIRKV